MKEDVLACVKLEDRIIDRMAAEFTLHKLWEAEDEDAMIDGLADRLRAVFLLNMRGADAAFMDRLPKLEIIATFGAGYERIDLEAARARNIRVTNVPATNFGCVADLAFGLMLDAVREITKADRFVRDGAWLRQRLYNWTPRFHGRKLGILGLGAIGHAVAKRAQGFDIEVAYHNRNRRDDVPYAYMDSPLALAEWADYLLASCPGGAATHHIVDAKVLTALGPAGVFVNIARGQVVDQAALVAALRDGTIAAAGLDVFDGEPQVPQALIEMDNVVLTPHCGGLSYESGEDSVDLAVRNLKAHFAGEPLLTPVA